MNARACKYRRNLFTLCQFYENPVLKNMKLTLRNGREVCYDGAQVMGIINVTPDSFFAGSRCQEEETLRGTVRNALVEGATMIDLGAYSTRPDAEEVSPEEEMQRLAKALPIVKEEITKFCAENNAAEPLISIDTFKADVAKQCIEEFDVDIINDVSGGTLDEKMFEVILSTNTPYILMHMRGTPKTMQTLTDYPEGVTNAVIDFFGEQISKLEGLKASIILDPGFGFAKTVEQNYQLFGNIPAIKSAFPEYPLLVGISRKSMIYKILETGPENALNGTMILNALAVTYGADILRVHDVQETANVVKQLKC